MTASPGLPNTESNRALDMYMKTRYLAERGGGIVFATGTPISNTMAEMYTLQRYLAPEMLEGRGRRAFRRLGRQFRRGRHRARTRAGRLRLPHAHPLREIRQPAGAALDVPVSFADVQTADMLHLPRPEIEGGKPHITAAPASPELKEFVGTLVERAQKLRTAAASTRAVDNMLKITGDGRKAALDMRLVDPFAEITAIRRSAAPSSKIYQHLGGRQGQALDAACLLRPLDAQSRPLQRL